MQVKSIAECSKGSSLQYFRPSLSYHFALRSLFCLLFEWPLKTGFTVVGMLDTYMTQYMCEYTYMLPLETNEIGKRN